MHQFNPTHVIGCDKSLFSITHQGILVALQFRYECNSLVFCNCKERKRERERKREEYEDRIRVSFFYFAHKLSGKKFGCVGATSYPRREKKERKKEEREKKKARSMIFEKVGELE